MVGFQRWQAALFSAVSSWWLCFIVSFFFGHFFSKSRKPSHQIETFSRYFSTCFVASVWERAHWKMFPFEKLPACPVVRCDTVCSLQLDGAASSCNQTRISVKLPSSKKRFRGEFLKSGLHWSWCSCRISSSLNHLVIFKASTSGDMQSNNVMGSTPEIRPEIFFLNGFVHSRFFSCG